MMQRNQGQVATAVQPQQNLAQINQVQAQPQQATPNTFTAQQTAFKTPEPPPSPNPLPQVTAAPASIQSSTKPLTIEPVVEPHKFINTTGFDSRRR